MLNNRMREQLILRRHGHYGTLTGQSLEFYTRGYIDEKGHVTPKGIRELDSEPLDVLVNEVCRVLAQEQPDDEFEVHLIVDSGSARIEVHHREEDGTYEDHTDVLVDESNPSVAEQLFSAMNSLGGSFNEDV